MAPYSYTPPSLDQNRQRAYQYVLSQYMLELWAPIGLRGLMTTKVPQGGA
jgi:hypothetical protein